MSSLELNPRDVHNYSVQLYHSSQLSSDHHQEVNELLLLLLMMMMMMMMMVVVVVRMTLNVTLWRWIARANELVVSE